MKSKLLAAAAAFAFVATGVAYAQDNPAKHEQPAQARSQERGPSAAPHAEAPRAAQAEPRREMPGKDKAEMRQPAPAPRAADNQRRDEPKAGETNRTEPQKPAMNDKTGNEGAPRAADNQRRDEPKAGEANRAEPQKPAMNDKTGNEGARTARVEGRIKATPEHAQRIGEMLRGNARPERVNVAVRVGERIPETVVIRPLPAEVIAFAPEYQGYDYFVDVNDEIVFVSPDTHEIVGMISYDGAPVVAGAHPCPIND